MNHPLISIIVPVYNVERYLSRCIDSILAQTFTNFELLLIDDGSTDKSGNICDAYALKDNRIRVFHKNNAGPSHARNYGLNVSIGQWIAFIDSDDFVASNYIETFIKYNNTFDTNIQVIQGYHLYSDEQLDCIFKDKQYYYIELTIHGNNDNISIAKQRLLHKWEVWGRMFSKKVIQNNKIKFNEKVSYGEDGMFWHEYILHLKKIIYVPEQNYYYNKPMQGTSICQTHKFNYEEELELIYFYKSYHRKLISAFSIEGLYANDIYKLYLDRYLSLYKSVKHSLIDLAPNTDISFFKVKSTKGFILKYFINPIFRIFIR